MKRNGVSNASRNGGRNTAPTRPDPTRPTTRAEGPIHLQVVRASADKRMAAITASSRVVR